MTIATKPSDFVLASPSGVTAAVSPFGARLTRVEAPDRDGRIESVLLGLEDAGEGLGDQVADETRRRVLGVRGRVAGGAGEGVDEFEDEEAGEGAAEVGDAVHVVSKWHICRA